MLRARLTKMITLDQVTTINIDDYIRQELNLGKTKVNWDERTWQILEQFKPNLKNGDKYLGIVCIRKHYREYKVMPWRRRHGKLNKSI